MIFTGMMNVVFTNAMFRERRDWFEAATAPAEVDALTLTDIDVSHAITKEKYRHYADKILSLEAALNSSFDTNCDARKPVIWPVPI